MWECPSMTLHGSGKYAFAFGLFSAPQGSPKSFLSPPLGQSTQRCESLRFLDGSIRKYFPVELHLALNYIGRDRWVRQAAVPGRRCNAVHPEGPRVPLQPRCLRAFHKRSAHERGRKQRTFVGRKCRALRPRDPAWGSELLGEQARGARVARVPPPPAP